MLLVPGGDGQGSSHAKVCATYRKRDALCNSRPASTLTLMVAVLVVGLEAMRIPLTFLCYGML